jgi:pre-mRNA-processing factor 19
VSVDETGDLALFGGADGVAGVYSTSQQKVVQVLKAGSPITATTWWGSRAVVATAAGTVKIFENGNEIAQLGSHAGAVTSLSLHPSGAILASGAADKRVAYYDLTTFKTVTQILVPRRRSPLLRWQLGWQDSHLRRQDRRLYG